MRQKYAFKASRKASNLVLSPSKIRGSCPIGLIFGCCWAPRPRGSPPPKGGPPPRGLLPSDRSSLRGLPPKGHPSSGSPPPPSREGHSNSAGIPVATSPSVYVLVIVTMVGGYDGGGLYVLGWGLVAASGFPCVTGWLCLWWWGRSVALPRLW